MPLRIYNSLTKQKEEFTPIEPGKVRMYVCGPTVYDDPHIGHLRSAYVFDVIRRYLVYSGYEVTFVRNVTDVDDKIIDKARQSGTRDLLAEVSSVSEKYLRGYKNDLKTLGVQEPTHEPRATEHIPDMVRLIGSLLRNGAAYESGGDVYFSVNAFKNYGRLSHQRKDEMLDHVRVDPNEKKKDPLDFALWKKSKEGEPLWESPWGPGRPGWHIECSAMSMKYLGGSFDIHGGGRDLIFPHHENEIAQSQAATGASFARWWVHHGLVTVNEQKMSKSLRNYVTLTQIDQRDPSAGIAELKFLFLGTHYSAPLDFSDEKMKMEKSIRNGFLYFFEDMERRKKSGIRPKSRLPTESFKKAFQAAMDDDFNTPLAMAVMHEMMHAANKAADSSVMVGIGEELKKWFALIFGIGFESAPPQNEKEIQKLIDERNQARLKKDYKKADEIRSRLLAEGKELIDTKDGETYWRRKL